MKSPATIVSIIFIIAITTGLLFLSNHYKEEQLQQDEKAIKGKNVLQTIIDSTKNRDPFFNASLKGKIIVIDLWTARFPLSMNQIPDLNKLAKDFAGDKTVFVAIDPADSTKEMNVLKERDIQFDFKLLFNRLNLVRLLFNEASLSGNAVYQPSYPINIVINPAGGIEIFNSGNQAMDMENIKGYLAGATGKTPQP